MSPFVKTILTQYHNPSLDNNNDITERAVAFHVCNFEFADA